MSTSNNTNWELNRDQLIKGAMQIVGALAKGQAPDAEDIADGTRMLNGVLALASADGMPLWKRNVRTIPLVSGQRDYLLADVLKVTDVFLQDVNGGGYNLMWSSLQDFLDSYSSTASTPSMWTTDQQIKGTILKVWPTASDQTITTKSLQIVIQEKFDGMFSATDTLDFPSYWTDPIMYQLAVRMAPVYGLPVSDRTALLREAQMYYELAKDFTPEESSIYFQVERR